MPVESGVAPAGPSAPVGPALSVSGLVPGAELFPSYGAGLDLRGGLPLLPSPVPGLIGPALNFVGNAPEAAAVKPEAGATQVAPAPAAAGHGRAADTTPALPAKISPGAASPAISRDREAAVATPGGELSPSRAAGDDAPENPFVESASLARALPEKAAGLGRKLFDQSGDANRGILNGPSSALRQTFVLAATIIAGGTFGPGWIGRLSPRGAGTVLLDAGRGTRPGARSPTGETLRDALTSAPGAARSGGAVSFFRSAAPNGDLSVSAGAPGVAVLGVPRPLALDLSRSGLIVRVRSVLNGTLSAPAQSAAPAAELPAPGPSTALLERGAMLEAFSVARAYADGEVAQPLASPPSAGGLVAAARNAPLAPAPESSPAPLWWALFVLPLLAAAFRGIL